MNPSPRRSLDAVLLWCSLVVVMARAQYVEDSIDVGGAWVGSLVYNARDDVVYGASEKGPFFAIACSTNTLAAWYSLGHSYVVCYDSLDNKAYCTITGSSKDSLAVIDGRTHQRIKALPMRGSSVPVWDPINNCVYVSCQTASSVAVVDCASDSLLSYIMVGNCPIKMYANGLRHKLYVLNSDEGTVSIVDMTTNSVIKTIEVGGIPNAGYYCRSLDRFFCGGNDRVAVIDGGLDSVVATIRVAQHSDVFAISGNDARGVVLASVYGGGSRIYTIDAGTNEVDTVLQVGDGTYAIYLSRQSDRFYCTSSFTDEIVVLSGDGRQHLKTLHVADDPFVIAQSSVRGRLYVGHLGSSQVYVIRDATTAWPEGQLSIPDTASGLRLDPSPFRDRLSIISGVQVGAGVVRVCSDDGRVVRLLNAAKSAGKVLRLTWDSRDNRGRLVPPGVYILTAPGGFRAKAVKLR
jgi:YVTN family beta-propeller protein